jgi:hypothetical protein
LSDHGEDADDHLVGLRHVGRHETDVGLLKAEEEVGVAREAIERRDHQGRAVQNAIASASFGRSSRASRSRPPRTRQELPASAVLVVLNRLPLRLKPRPRAPCLFVETRR